ncbi:sensor histidine kinase [Glaciecola petra]|uniref:Histidine kinase n=1 Tax=Glaciecola petra TaxID=3075602 RepID=A0ABU2ZSM5_9ALTE|nr:histidine kinase [Aestuariibacter sp. P117]MDT0595314.1 histidine kinase [Aestuariibacter sp. P117]
MTTNIFSYVQTSIEKNPRYRFWFWQIGFWLFMCVVGFFTVTLWYGNVNSNNFIHSFMQAIIGITCSLFLHQSFNFLSRFPLSYRTAAGLTLVLGIAFIWTLLHMQMYVQLTGFEDVWLEFGGWYFSGIFIFLCWTGLFHGIRYYELLQHEHQVMLQAEATTREEHLKRVHAQSDARDAKLKMLRYQLNPHFLCNTLNAINSLIEIGESSKAQEMSVQLSEFLRYSLDTDPSTKTSLSEEIDALNLYLEIEKTRFDERLQVDIDIQPQAEKAVVPSLLLQPIIENSMKHAIAKSETGGWIKIEAKVNAEKKLIMTISDSGSGKEIPEIDFLKAEKGVGITNIYQRLKALYRDQFEIESHMPNNGGLITIISIPYEEAVEP